MAPKLSKRASLVWKPGVLKPQGGIKKKPSKKWTVRDVLAPADDDNDLMVLLKEQLGRFTDAELYRLRKSVRERKLSTSSACSGSGIAEVALHNIFTLFGATENLTVEFLCEAKPNKQDFLKQVAVRRHIAYRFVSDIYIYICVYTTIHIQIYMQLNINIANVNVHPRLFCQTWAPTRHASSKISAS